MLFKCSIMHEMHVLTCETGIAKLDEANPVTTKKFANRCGLSLRIMKNALQKNHIGVQKRFRFILGKRKYEYQCVIDSFHFVDIKN